jgi:hypothetical protein
LFFQNTLAFKATIYYLGRASFYRQKQCVDSTVGTDKIYLITKGQPIRAVGNTTNLVDMSKLFNEINSLI